MSPATKSSRSATTITITNTIPAASSETTRCTFTKLKYAMSSICDTGSPTKTADASVGPVSPVSPAKTPPTKKTNIFSKCFDEASTGIGSSNDKIDQNKESRVEVDTPESLKPTFDISQACRLIDYIVCKAFDSNEQYHAYIVKLKQKYNGMDFIRIEESILNDCRKDLIENYAEKFICDRLELLPEAASSLAAKEITNLAMMLSGGEMWYLLEFQNFETGNHFWVSEHDVTLYYSALLAEFKRSLESAVDTPLIVRNNEEIVGTISSNDDVILSSVIPTTKDNGHNYDEKE